MKNNYKLLIFDLDDTLIDNTENVKYAFQKTMEHQNAPCEEEKFMKRYHVDRDFRRDWQNGLITLPEELRGETGKKSDRFLDWVRAQRFLIYFDHTISLERAIELNHIYLESLTEVVIPVQGAEETLKYLSDLYTIIVATNGPSIATQQKLEKINCSPFIKEILPADMFGYMKPRVEFFEAIQERYPLPKENYLIIGDSLKSDVGFGMKCGIDSCRFDRGNEELTAEYQPTLTIKKLTELTTLL